MSMAERKTQSCAVKNPVKRKLTRAEKKEIAAVIEGFFDRLGRAIRPERLVPRRTEPAHEGNGSASVSHAPGRRSVVHRP